MLENTFFVCLGDQTFREMIDHYVTDKQGHLKGHENLEKAITVGKRYISKNIISYFRVYDHLLNLKYLHDKHRSELECQQIVNMENIKRKLKEIK